MAVAVQRGNAVAVLGTAERDSAVGMSSGKGVNCLFFITITIITYKLYNVCMYVCMYVCKNTETLFFSMNLALIVKGLACWLYILFGIN